MQSKDPLAHWQSTYAAKGEDEVSWFQDNPEPSLALIEEIATPSSAVIDIGAGASRLADALLQRGFSDLTVLDLSSSALAAAKARIGDSDDHITWIVADVTTWEPTRTYDVWHDRAAFHFLITEPDRKAYLARLERALKPRGHAIIATFALDGPERCSGLPVMRYDADSLARTLGAAFLSVNTRRHDHVTPWGTSQAFQFGVFRYEP
ncbi:trans-aconitate 2-methyltransferase [Falsiroseomonas sp.]|uniref:class I SAM-dependent methyltransferase n=1 Tax=Falsiroseomonas sp. TaxID=2870721 RepID=UPI002717D5F6|nr:class I SAM-dependent methyltransferase [Falsiroseomonas sp.]MDO9501740.1 class I SAM-dependent methyltransferase [Falsiroseomonas sp.]